MGDSERDVVRVLELHSEEDTEKLGLEIAKELKPGDVLALIGDLGTGKTTLTRYIAKGLGIPEGITSPTFTIVNEHRGGEIPLFHFDAYRLEGQDPFETGIEEYFYQDGICVVEWADIIEDILPPETKYIYMSYGAPAADAGEDPVAEVGENTERIYRCTF